MPICPAMERDLLAALLLATSPILNLGVGQAYQIVSQIDCDISENNVDMNGAAATVSMGGGKKRVSLLFTTKWPWAKNSKIGVLALETQGKRTTLEELAYSADWAPISSNGPQLALLLGRGEATFYALTPRDDPKKWLWDYEEHQVLVDGATQTYKGICELKENGE
jgi:hypothetical protein